MTESPDIKTQGTLSFSLHGGRLTAGQAERALRRGAFDYGLEIKIEKLKSLFEVTLLVEVSGDEDALYDYQEAVKEWGASHGR